MLKSPEYLPLIMILYPTVLLKYPFLVTDSWPDAWPQGAGCATVGSIRECLMGPLWYPLVNAWWTPVAYATFIYLSKFCLVNVDNVTFVLPVRPLTWLHDKFRCKTNIWVDQPFLLCVLNSSLPLAGSIWECVMDSLWYPLVTVNAWWTSVKKISHAERVL